MTTKLFRLSMAIACSMMSLASMAQSIKEVDIYRDGLHLQLISSGMNSTDQSVNATYRLVGVTEPITKTTYELQEGVYIDNPWKSGSKVFARITEIGDEAFMNQDYVNTFILNKYITKIGARAFKNCDILNEVILPNGLTDIGNQAFIGCRCLHDVVLPASVKTVADDLFDPANVGALTAENYMRYSDTYLVGAMGPGNKEYPIRTGTRFIAQRAFAGCDQMTSITIPSTVEMLGDSVFQGCTSLESVVIPKSVTSIGKATFRDCSSLKTVTIPNSITVFVPDMFYGCTNLTDVYDYAVEPQNLPTRPKYGLGKATLHVPEGCLQAYQNSNIKNLFPNIVDDIYTKCRKPEIVVKNGVARFTCETPNAKLHLRLAMPSFNGTMDISKVSLTLTDVQFDIEAYTSAPGLEDSDPVVFKRSLIDKSMIGDVNGDSKIDMDDVVLLVDQYLNGGSKE